MASTVPELMNHVAAKVYEVTYFKPMDLIEEHGADEVDVPTLCETFKKYCNDYTNTFDEKLEYECLHFAKRVIFEIGPESRSVKAGQPDKHWKFNFENKVMTDNTKKTTIKYAFVATFKFSKPKQKSDDEMIILTVKQAGYIALSIFEGICKLGVNHDRIILTPLAGAIFSRADIEKIFKESKKVNFSSAKGDIKPTSLDMVVMCINCSCQPGGHYLQHSTLACSMVATITATKNLKDDGLKKKIFNKLVKQYIHAGKTMNMDMFRIFAKYAHGGVPAQYNYDTLYDIYAKETSTISKREAVLASTSSLMTTRDA